MGALTSYAMPPVVCAARGRFALDLILRARVVAEVFVPVSIRVGAGERTTTAYDRSLDLVGAKLTAFQRHAADMKEPLTTIGAALRDMVAGQFIGEGAAGLTGKWAVLSDNPPGH